MLKIFFSILSVFVFSAFLIAGETDIQPAAPDSLPDENYSFRVRPNIAVFPFYDANAQAKEVEFGRTVSAMLATALRSKTNFIVLERSELDRYITKDSPGMSGITRELTESLSKIYQIEVILSGDVSLINNTLHIDARLVDAHTSKIVVALYSTCQDLKNIRLVVEGLAAQLEQTYLRQWMGSITITSQPSSEVYLDDKYLGETDQNKPLEIKNMLEGIYHLKFVRGGFYDWEGDITVLAKMERSVTVSLIAKPGSMNIYSEPKGAQIFVDNNFMGETPMSLKTVAEGEHEIRLVKNNYQEWTQKVFVRSFQPTDVKATLEVSPGILSINTNPPGASIYFKGRNIAKTPHTLTNLSPGEVVLQLDKEGYESWTTSVLIAPNSREYVDIMLKEKRGWFSLSSKPDGAKVYMLPAKADDPRIYIGTSPILNYEATIGNYTLEVEKEDYFTGQTTVSVQHNEVSDVGVTLIEKPGSILVSTEPANARIYIDGAFKGRTPYRLATIPKGDYRIRTSMPFADHQQEIVVTPNQLTRVDHKFDKSNNYLYSTFAAGAVILVLTLLAN